MCGAELLLTDRLTSTLAALHTLLPSGKCSSGFETLQTALLYRFICSNSVCEFSDTRCVDYPNNMRLFLSIALDHGKALVYEHSKRLLINLIIVLVCRGDHVSLAQSLFNFITISEQGLGKHGLLKSSWTLDVGNIVGVAGSSAGAGTGVEYERQGPSVESNAASAGTSTSG